MNSPVTPKINELRARETHNQNAVGPTLSLGLTNKNKQTTSDTDSPPPPQTILEVSAGFDELASAFTRISTAGDTSEHQIEFGCRFDNTKDILTVYNRATGNSIRWDLFMAGKRSERKPFDTTFVLSIKGGGWQLFTRELQTMRWYSRSLPLAILR